MIKKNNREILTEFWNIIGKNLRIFSSGLQRLSSEVVASATARVGEIASEPKPKRRKTTQHTYSAERRASTGKYASLHGPAAAVKHFMGMCGHAVPESTVRMFRYAYHAELKSQSSAHSGPVSVSSLPCKPKGRPLLVGNLDNLVKQYIVQLRAAGGVINVDVVMAAARGIVESKNQSLLVEYGGKIAIERSWAKIIAHQNDLCETQRLYCCKDTHVRVR